MRIQILLGGVHHDFEGFAAFMNPVLRQAGHSVKATYDLGVLTDLGSDLCDLALQGVDWLTEKGN